MSRSPSAFPLRFFLVTLSCFLLAAPVTAIGQEAATAADGETQAETEPDTPAAPDTEDAIPELEGLNLEPDAGQEDLDKAAVLRFDAKTPRETQAVERLLQSAIKKGLSGENASFAKKMMGSVMLQKGQQLIAAMGQARGKQALAVRDEALRTLNSAIESDPEQVEAYLLVARLNMLTGGDKQAVSEATTKAIEILAGNPVERSKALVLRALTWGPGEEDQRKEDLDSAIKDDPRNVEALQARAAVRLQAGDVEGAVADMEQILAEDPTNRNVAREVVRRLAELDRVDDALELLTKALEAKPSEGLYSLRAMVYRMKERDDDALSDLNKAIAMQPKDPIALLARAEVSISKKDLQSAKDDLRAAKNIDPRVGQLEQAILVGCLIAIEEGRMADAINAMKLLLDNDPGNEFRQLQLANLYIQDERPRKAIELLDEILDRDPKNIGVLRSRADAFLSVGDHEKAIADYEQAIKVVDDSTSEYNLSGILNNLAWVLSTSPQDGVRDGKRAVELGERAVELTKEEEPHILSTLAAGYAEMGNFEKAIEWSNKAVELGKSQDHQQIEQLEEELESYRAKKPWREKQETEENSMPILSPDDLIDT